jgi:glucose dehydrogenase
VARRLLDHERAALLRRLVITGFSGGEMASRGKVKAFSARDGKPVWTFNTIPGPGEFGHDTWPADSTAWQFGGAPVWQTPAVDPALNLVYFSTGNPGPDLHGGVRPGDNLFSVSIVAVDAHTGKYRWHFQQVHHDIWDYDSPNPVSAVRRADQRRRAPRPRASLEDGLGLHLGSRDGQAADRHRRARGAARAAPSDGRDAAVPDRGRLMAALLC